MDLFSRTIVLTVISSSYAVLVRIDTLGIYTEKQLRLGGDSQMTFGHCALCIHPAVEPMATPSGHIYCKECIVEFLLAKTQELKRQKEAFGAQETAKGNR